MAMTEEQAAEVLKNLSSIGSLVTWLYVLVGVVGLALGWSLHRLAKNQVATAELLRQAAGAVGGAGEAGD